MTSIRRIFQAVLLLFAAAAATLPFAAAQSLPSNLPQGLIDQLNRSAQGNIPVDPSQMLLSPLDQVRGQQQQQQFFQRASRLPLPRSQLEADYSRRAGIALTQYGYDVFRNLVPSNGELQNGAVADNYRLSSGDELVITLEGQVSRSLRTRIDREGRLVVPDLPPIAAAGRSFAEVRSDLEKEVSAGFLNTNVFVSVGSVRQISVAVLGEAVAPGMYRMGGFGTVLDALAMAGGIRKTGSLRRITIVRGGHDVTVDLYRIMNDGGPQPDLSIGDGDRIVIPPIGPTIAVAGEVDRPGIYELVGRGVIDGRQLLSLAGAALRPSGNRFVRFSLDDQGRDRTTEASAVAQLTFRPGDMLLVLRKNSGAVGSVRLDGHVAVPGIRSLTEAPDLRRLVGSTTFLANPYLLFGVLVTTDDVTHGRRYVPIDLEAVVNGRQDRPLKDGDTLVVLGVGDINYIDSADVQAVLRGEVPPLMRQQIVTRNPRALNPNPPQRGVTQGTRGYNQGMGSPGMTPEQQQQGFAQGQQSMANGQQAPQDEMALLAQEGLVGGGQENPGGAQAALAGEDTPLAGEEAPLAGDEGPLAGEAGSFLGLQSPPDYQQQPGTGGAGQLQGRPFNTIDLLAQRRAQICRGLQQLASIVATNPSRFVNARAAEMTSATSVAAVSPVAGRLENVFPCPPIFEKYPELLTLAVEHVAAIDGEVQLPGLYPVVPGVPLASAVADAGGLTLDVDLRRVEITHYAGSNGAGGAAGTRQLLQLTPADLTRVALNPGDVVRFNPVFIDRDNGPVLLSGEFRRPGYFDIRRGERLSGLIERAGGLTDQAFPYGAVFTRLRVKRDERDTYSRAANQLESGLTSALGRGNVEQSQALVAATQQMVAQLRTTPAVGRVVVEADPTVLQVKPQFDPIMEAGDQVFMPKRPFYVAVSGEVLNPTSLQFRAGATPADYIKEAGGFSQDAEDDSTFVVLPNGEAEPVKTSFWNFTPVQVPPGSTIIVPKDLRPFDLTTFLKDSTQILSQLAISAASLAILHGNSTQ